MALFLVRVFLIDAAAGVRYVHASAMPWLAGTLPGAKAFVHYGNTPRGGVYLPLPGAAAVNVCFGVGKGIWCL
jgi:hypothetical protein